MNRAERRRLLKKGVPRAEVERRAAFERKIDRHIRDAAVQAEADTATQRAMWLMVVSIADAYGFGPKRLQKFFEALQTNTEQLNAWRAENGEDYAYEKLRQAAEKCTGTKIQYLYEQDWREKLKEGKL